LQAFARELANTPSVVTGVHQALFAFRAQHLFGLEPCRRNNRLDAKRLLAARPPQQGGQAPTTMPRSTLPTRDVAHRRPLAFSQSKDQRSIQIAVAAQSRESLRRAGSH